MAPAKQKLFRYTSHIDFNLSYEKGEWLIHYKAIDMNHQYIRMVFLGEINRKRGA